MQNPKVSVGENRFGKCLIAASEIIKDEQVTDFDGPLYECEKASDLPAHAANHAIQVGEHQWRDSTGFARLINHSCEPNCGMSGLFTIVAMRNIPAGEELTIDYEMFEDSDWNMECLCGTPSCRKHIGSFRNMPQITREKYKGYISPWLVEKYNLS